MSVDEMLDWVEQHDGDAYPQSKYILSPEAQKIKSALKVGQLMADTISKYQSGKCHDDRLDGALNEWDALFGEGDDK